MGTCCSKQPPVCLDIVSAPKEHQPPLALPPPVTPWRYTSVFWATPVFIYNQTLPKDGYEYTPVHPVEPFRAQQYTIKF
jgi:hypothetical protein